VNAVLLSDIPFRGLLLSLGLVLPGIAVFAVVYRRFPERRYLGMIAVASTAAVQSLCQFGLVWYGAYLNDIPVAMQYHRLAAMASAAVLFTVPYFLSVVCDSTPGIARISRGIARVGLAVIAAMWITAFVAPGLFVSVTIPDMDFMHGDVIDRGRGETGIVYLVRNALLFLVATYAAVVAIIDFVKSQERVHSFPVALGLVIAALLGIDDLFRLFAGRYTGVFTQLSYSRFGVGTSILVLLSMYGLTLRFVDDARSIRSTRINLQRDTRAIERFAFTDNLTGLGNAAKLDADLDRLLPVAAGGLPLGLVTFDVERFRVINATYGISRADRCLAFLARRLRDLIENEEQLYRLNGNTFAVVVPGSDELVAARARTLAGAFAEPLEIDSHRIDVPARAGVAIAPTHATRPAQLLARCEAAREVANSAHAPVVVFTDALKVATDRYGEIVRGLHIATEQDQFRLMFQPIVDSDQAIVAAEALLRWDHPLFGPVSPGEFIPIAEDVGLIVPITRLVSRKIVETLAELRERGIGLTISMNLSVRELRRPSIGMELRENLLRLGLEPERLVIEVTEIGVMQDLTTAAGSLRSLADAGFTVAIDDFGTGYSSFAYLRELPVGELKIDRSFLVGYPQDEKATAMVQSVIELAHSLELTTVAEGVETAEQFEALKRDSCDLLQGFLFHRPMQFEELIDNVRLNPVDRG